MDIFKLLARSTNLQKSKTAAKRSTCQNIPSAGVSSHPQLLSEEYDAPQTSISRQDRKRKREESLDELIGGSVEDLDFFGTHPKYASNSSEDPGRAGKELDDQQKQRLGEEASELPTKGLDEEECRRLFKIHKLKVHLVSQQIEAPIKKKRKKESTVPPPLTKDSFTQLTSQPLVSFKDLRTKYCISRRLYENLKAQGYTKPTEVQIGSLPLLLGSDVDRGLGSRSELKGRSHENSNINLLTIAPTGSGKTLAFLIPVLYGLLQSRHATKETFTDDADKKEQVQAIILAPTHELADQIVNEARKLAIGTGIRVSGMRKGMKLHPASDHDSDEQADNPEISSTLNTPGKPSLVVKSKILVSTPLTLLHALTPSLSPSTSFPNPHPLPSIRYLVLDEADVLLDPLFRPQTLAIWTACTSHTLQTTLWSATIGSSIESLALAFLTSRGTPHPLLRLLVGLKDSALPSISHRLIYTGSEQGKLLAIRQLLHPTSSSSSDPNATPSLTPPFLIFTQTIPRAIALHAELLYDIPLPAGGSSRLAVLHSDLSATARSSIISSFRAGQIWILITTDLLSRGLDFRGVNGVVSYDIPSTGAGYVHRAGRTGRGGREGGVAVTFYTKEDIPYVKNIANVISRSRKNGAKGRGGEVDGDGDMAEEGNQGKRNGDGHGIEGVQQWLLDALPNVSKKSRNEIRKRGVEVRRTGRGENGERKSARISTKSGYDRRGENRRKGAMEGIRRRRRNGGEGDEEGDGEVDGGTEWSGFDD